MFCSFYTILFLCSMLPVIFFSGDEIVLYLQNFKNPILDFCTSIVQYSATWYGYFVFLLVLIASNLSIRKVCFAGFSYFFVSIVVQLLKRFVFHAYLRPHIVLNLNGSFIEKEQNMSLPSGHAATIFTIVTVLYVLFSFLCFLRNNYEIFQYIKFIWQRIKVWIS